MLLKLSDSVSNQKVVFDKSLRSKFYMYVCGITPYSFSHIGHGRSYVNFDVLFRLTSFLGYEVKYVRNFTDIDDKLLNKAEQELGHSSFYSDIAKKYIEDFHLQMESLNCKKPFSEPLVTQSIPEIIDIIKKLLQKGFAYKSGDDIFFDVLKFKSYGKLSKKNIEDLVAGTRVAVNENKNNPLDFVLWKGNSNSEFWETELGFGRPGWHIECSAMIAANFDDVLDVHGGGADLIFPHHENEIAQSEAVLNKDLAKCWMHNGLLNINREKMSKSLSNDLSLKSFFQKHSPQIFRFYVLQHHYASPIDFCEEKILDAQKAFIRLSKLSEGVCLQDVLLPKDLNHEFYQNSVVVSFLQALADDLNTAKAIGILFKHFDEILSVSVDFRSYFVVLLEEVLGLRLSTSFVEEIKNAELEVTEEIEELLQARKLAREVKDWKKADFIREKLFALGYKVVDKK